jgi:hypothetical protein
MRTAIDGALPGACGWGDAMTCGTLRRYRGGKVNRKATRAPVARPDNGPLVIGTFTLTQSTGATEPSGISGYTGQ